MRNVSKFTKLALVATLLLPVCGQMQAWTVWGACKSVWKYKEAVVGAGIGAGIGAGVKACLDRRVCVGGEEGNLTKILIYGAAGGALGFAWSYFQKGEHEKTRAKIAKVDKRLGEKIDKVKEGLDQVQNTADLTRQEVIDLRARLNEVKNQLEEAIERGNNDIAVQLKSIYDLLVQALSIKRQQSK